MATGSSKDVTCQLVNVGTLTLEPSLKPWGIFVSGDMLMVTDDEEDKLHVYRLRDGMLLSISGQLEAGPRGICYINDKEICVALSNGTIDILSIDNTGVITMMRKLHLKPAFNRCYGVARITDKVVLCGVKKDTICWCIVSLQDGQADTVHEICNGWYCHLSTNDNMIYVACNSGHSVPDHGVYGYNIQNPTQQPFIYKHRELGFPSGVTVDGNGFLFICSWRPPCIHHVTDKCELVNIYREGIPSKPNAILWNRGILYVTSWKSNVITRYKPEYSHHQDTASIPAEILRMNNRSIQLFKEALKDGEAKVYNIRVMVVGHLGVGKTTLIKRFLEKEVNINEQQSTEGIIVHVHCCKVSHDGLKWTLNEGDSEQNLRLQRLAQVLNDQVQKRNLTDKRVEQVEIIHQREGHGHVNEIIYQMEKKDHAADHVFQPSSEPDKFPSNQSSDQGVKEMESAAGLISDDPAMEILKLLHDKADKLKRGTDIPLTMVDFAGHFAFYTTHQTFLTDRAIYLLVSDISKQITDPVTDDCYFDTEGIKLCKVYELVEVWLNSIHSCTPSPGAKTPPVILVGTHVDQIQQDSREEVCQRYFHQIRYEYLGTKPTIVHLADEDFAIDNTVIDQKLDNLKKKIIQLASEQPYWGQAIPVRWLTLEEHLMNLKAAGVKVIPYSLLEEMNQKEPVKIESKEELDLFLKFQHGVGNILYFETEGLKEQITLDPQWLIYCLRTIITAENFILKKLKTPAVIEKWREFKKTGKLTQELIDAIWTKENNPDCHANKDLILGLMEQLNIIARPLSFSKDGDQVKEKSYFLAPCMLQQETPEEVICPKPNQQIESSPVMCYVFTSGFLPSPIFHRLVAVCVAHWPVAKKKKEQTEENLIFCGCCIFQLDQQHKLTLHFREHVIFLRVTRMGIKDKTPSSKMCIEVREFITTNLLKIIGYLGQSLKFEYYIQCPEYSGVSINSLIPVSLLKENSEVHCDFHDHMIESCNVLDFWFEDQEQSGDSGAWRNRNLEVQDETKVSQAGNLKAEVDLTESVHVHKQLVQLAMSVGIIRTPSTIGTGFRVGPDYIMTARHVVEPIVKEVSVFQQHQMPHIRQLDSTKVYIDFSYELNGVPTDPNLMFEFEPEIVYENDYLDTVILKLKHDSRPYPPPFTNFWDVSKSPPNRGPGYFIGHSRGDIKRTDRYQFVMLEPCDIISIKNWSMEIANEDGYLGIDNKHRILFHCSFEKGASGAPGFWINPADGQACLELMLLCGYPTWFYDKLQGQMADIPKSCLFEQGVSLKLIYDDLKARNESLCNKIFEMR